MGLVLTTTALMGSSFAVGKIGLQYASPLLLVGLRFTLAGAIMALLIRRRPQPRGLAQWGRIAVIGAFQTAGLMAALFIGLRTIPAAESSILTFTNPLMVVILGTWFAGRRYRARQWFGVALGFFGVLITLGFHLGLQAGTWYTLAGALSWAIATLLIDRWGAQFDLWALTAYQMLSGGLLLLLAAFTLERPHLVLTPESVSIILWLAIAASIVQFAIWFHLLRQGDPGETSAYLFLAPFFGVLFGWLLLGERVGWPLAVGGVPIFVGIFLANRKG